MVSKKLQLLAVVGVLLCGWAAGAQAASVGGKFGIFGDIGFSTFTMSDVNAEMIKPVNDSAATFGASGKLNEINSGLTLGGGAQYGIVDNLLIGLELEYLMAGSKTDFSLMGSTNTVEISLPLLAIGGFIKGVLPLDEKLLLTGGVGVDSLSLSGKISSSGAGGSASSDIKGSGLGVRLLVGGQYFLMENFSLGLDLGYRIAKIPEIKDEHDNVAIKSNGEKATVDYSGLIARLGVGFFF